MKLKTKEIIVIAIIYVLFLIIVTGPAMSSDSMVGFWVVLIVGLFSYFRFSKGKLNDSLSRFPWPVWLVIMLILGTTIGIFIAPYHLGKWIASKIPDNMDSTCFSVNSKKIDISEDELRKKTYEELEKMYTNIAYVIMPSSHEPATKKIPNNLIEKVYGCGTWGEARDLFDLLAKIMNERRVK